MSKFYEIQLDLETTGISPDHAGILQIAAVKFNSKERTIKTDSMFDRCLHLLPGRHWEEGTRDWWYGRNREVLETILPRREEPVQVLKDFADWIVADNDCAEPLRIFSKPISFDLPILVSHWNQIGQAIPYHYRYAVDQNSFIRGLGHDSNGELYFKEFEGSAHNALHDCINQIGNLFAAMDHYDDKRKTSG